MLPGVQCDCSPCDSKDFNKVLKITQKGLDLLWILKKGGNLHVSLGPLKYHLGTQGPEAEGIWEIRPHVLLLTLRHDFGGFPEYEN